MGGLVRYRLSELSAWATRTTAVQGRDQMRTHLSRTSRMIDFNDVPKSA
jgi:hypothetical protein